MIELLIEERNKAGQGLDNHISNEELIDELKTFLIAASDTTSSFLTANILSIFGKPEVLDKLRKEINSVIKSD